jgi:hypothetical protein
VAITHFTFEAEPMADFVQFGFALYRQDPNWIEPLEKHVFAQLSPNASFFQNPGNRHRNFLARAGKRVIGRISAMVNHDLKDPEGIPVGTVGFFECIADLTVARDLFYSAARWLQRDQGVYRIWGPMNFDIWHSYRLMTRGFDQKPFLGEPYNKAYYQEFFEDSGFKPKYRWGSVEITAPEAIAKMALPHEEAYRRLMALGYRFLPLDMTRWESELGKLHFVLNRSFENFTGFTPIPLPAFRRLFEQCLCAFHPQLFAFLHDEHNAIAGFAVALLELSDATRAMKGKGSLMAMLKFLYHRRRVNRINFYLLGITPEEAKKKTGAGRAGFYFILNRILKEGFNTALLALMAQGGRAFTLLGEDTTRPQREYVLYELNL